jgi:hypothetical protein
MPTAAALAGARISPRSLGAAAPVGRGAARHPSWGPALVLTFVATASIGVYTIQVASIPFADLLFLAAAGMVCGQLLMGNTRHLASAAMRRAPVQLVVGSLLLIGAGTWSSLWVEDPGGSILIVLRFVWLTLAWSWLLRSVAAGRLAIDRLVGGYRAAVWINAALAVAGNFGLGDLADDGGRQMAFTAHPNHLGGLLAVGLPFVLLDVRTTSPSALLDPRPGQPAGPRRWSRSLPFRLASTGVVVFALSTTGSMTALGAGIGGIAAMGIMTAIARGKPRRHSGPLVAIAVASAVALGVAGLVASGAPTIERLIGYSQGDAGVEASVESRGEQDGYVIDNFDRYLVTGSGFDQDDPTRRRELGLGIHNNVLRLLFEAGIPAVIGLLVLWLLAARQGWRLLFNTRGTPLHTLVVALLGSFLTASLFAQFHPLAYERYYWYPLVMIGAMWSLRRHELAPAN